MGKEQQVAIRYSDMDLARIVDWTADGARLLVNLGIFSGPGGPERNCSDLYLVDVDGGATTRLTYNGAGGHADGGGFSPDGKSFTYVTDATDIRDRGEGPKLLLRDAQLARRVLDPNVCANGDDLPFAMGRRYFAWSPDNARLALLCQHSVNVYEPSTGTVERFPLPRRSIGTSLIWRADSRRLLVATPNEGEPQNVLSIVEISAATGHVGVVSTSDVDIEWVIGPEDGSAYTFSPDGAYLVASGGVTRAQPGQDLRATLYVMKTETGVTRPLDSPNIGCCVEWRPDRIYSFLYLDFQSDPEGTFRVMDTDLERSRLKSLGSIERIGVWHWATPPS